MGAVLYLGALFSERLGFGTGEVGLVYLAGGVGYLAGSAAAGSRLGAAEPRTTHAATTVGSGLLFGLAFATPFGPAFAVGAAVGGAAGGLLLALGGYPALGAGLPVFAVAAAALAVARRGPT
jgi:hypothetical protein